MSETGTNPSVLGTPIDAWYVWLGLAAASAATLGVASNLPVAPPPDASGAAETADHVAASQYNSTGEHPIGNANAVRIGGDTLSLRGPGGVADAEFGYGPVTPATDGKLARALRGEPPERLFDSPAAFDDAAADARDTEPEWHETDRFTVRRVTWEDVDVTVAG